MANMNELTFFTTPHKHKPNFLPFNLSSNSDWAMWLMNIFQCQTLKHIWSQKFIDLNMGKPTYSHTTLDGQMPPIYVVIEHVVQYTTNHFVSKTNR